MKQKLITTVIVAVLLFAAQLFAGQEIIAQDTFDIQFTGGLSWKPASGAWRMVPGQGIYQMTGSKQYSCGYTYAGSEDWSKYQGSVRVKYHENVTQFGMIICSQNNSSGYKVALDLVEHKLLVTKLPSNEAFGMISLDGVEGIHEGRWVDLRVDNTKDLINVWVNGRLLINDLYDRDKPLAKGKIGLFACGGKVDFDDVKISTPKAYLLKVQIPALKTLAKGEILRVDNKDLGICINKRTGLLSQLISLKPSPLSLFGSDSSGLDMIWQSLDKPPRYDRIDVLESLEQVKEDGQEVIRCIVVSRDTKHPVKVQMTYRIYPEHLGLDLKLTVDASEDGNWRWVVGSPVDCKSWPQMTYDVGAAPTNRPKGNEYSFKYNGKLPVPIVPLHWPYQRIIAEDRCMLWGSLNHATHLVLAPNYIEGTTPCFYYDFAAPQKGDTRAYSLIYKPFAGKYNHDTPIHRWFCENMYSSDPDLQDPPLRLRKGMPRIFGQGNGAQSCMLTQLTPIVSLPPTERAKAEKVLRQARQLDVKWLWHVGWGNFWANGQPIREEVANLQAKGFKVLLYIDEYFMPVLHKVKELEDPELFGKPLPDEWWYRDKTGKNTGELDWCRPEVRQWAFDVYSRGLEILAADGFCIDTGSWILRSMQYPSNYEPTQDIFEDGCLKFYRRLYLWCEKNHPQARFYNNGAGMPQSFYSDGAMLEFGGGKEPSRLVNMMRAVQGSIFCDINFVERQRSLFRQKDETPENMEKMAMDYYEMAMSNLALGFIFSPVLADRHQAIDHLTEESHHGEISEFSLNERLAPLTSFSSRANGLARVDHVEALETTGPITATCWAGSGSFQLAAYKTKKSKSDSVGIDVNLDVMKKYYSLLLTESNTMKENYDVVIMCPDATQKKAAEITTALTSNCFKIRTRLKEGQCLLVELK